MSSYTDPFHVDAAALATCAAEPIHIPGATQPRGVLLGLDTNADRVLFASENADVVLGRPVHDIVGQPLGELFDAGFCTRVHEALHEIPDGRLVTIERPAHFNAAFGAIVVHRCAARCIIEFLDEVTDELQGQSSRAAVAGELFVRITRGLHAEPGITALCDRVVREMRHFSGYDRVMIYRFHADAHGEVIAEARADHLEPFLGLHYPASDIPSQARELYLRNRVRTLGSVHDRSIRVLAADAATATVPLDLSYALLRAMSPIHLQYLANMGVEATLVLSIIVEGKLWGLLTCHHRTRRWPSEDVRAIAEMLSEFLSAQVMVQENYTRAASRATAATSERSMITHLLNAAGDFSAIIDELRSLVPCSGTAVVAKGVVHKVGGVPSNEWILALASWLREAGMPEVFATNALATVSGRFAEVTPTVCGVLSVRVSGTEDGVIMWFRPEHVEEIRWGGAPKKEEYDDAGVVRLSPRGSFAEWRHERKGQAAPWTLDDVSVVEGIRHALLQVVLELLSVRARESRFEFTRVRAAVDGASDAIIIADAGGRVIYANAAFYALCGHPPGEPIELTRVFDDLDSTESSERRLSTALRCHDGEVIPVSLRVDPVFDEVGRRIGMLYVSTDQRAQLAFEAERRRIEQDLAERQKLESLGVLAGGIAHDFNNLLTAIVANVALAHAEIPPANAAQESLAAIRSAAGVAAGLCRQLLAYAGRGQVDVESLSLNALIEDMGTLLRTAIGDRCTVRYEFAANLPLVEGDSTQLRQVILNLIVNAVEAMGGRDGSIEVATALRTFSRVELDQFRAGSTLDPGDYVTFRVTDDGSGMSPETMQRIFDPFFTTKFTGRGLGLAAVQGIVRAHHGALRLDSELGRGTTFSIILPPAAAATAILKPAASTSSDQSVEVVSARVPIMVVDDDPLVRVATARLLARAGYEVVQAANGEEAFALLRGAPIPPALVISDYSMPRLDGVGLLRAMRAAGYTIPMLLMSGYAADEGALNVDDARLAFMRKPFSAGELASNLRQMLGGESPPAYEHPSHRDRAPEGE